MPRGNGTGPAGAGPMTGRAAGFCAGYQASGYANPVGGRGRGFRGRGGGRGWRNWFNATGLPGWLRDRYGWPAWGTYPPSYGGQVPTAPTAEEELEMLQQQADGLKQTVGQIEQRIEQLRSETSDK